jgi:hypothetical protein
MLAGDESALRFICRRCLRIKRTVRAVLWAALAVVVGCSLLVAWLQGKL